MSSETAHSPCRWCACVFQGLLQHAHHADQLILTVCQQWHASGTLLVGGSGGHVGVFTSSAAQLHALPQPCWAWAVAVHPAGSVVAVGGGDGSISLHALDVRPMAALAGNLLVFRWVEP